MDTTVNTTVTLDSFQLIVGVYLLYTAIKGSGTLYNFFDLPDDRQNEVHRILRIAYAVCGVLALAEAVLCMALGGSEDSSLTSAISLGCSGFIILILVAVFVWLRRLAKQKKK